MAITKAPDGVTPRKRAQHPAPMVGAAAASPASDRAVSSDAMLIRIADQHSEHMKRFNDDGSLDDGDDCPFWLAYERSRNQISAARPATLQGVLAKARAAKAEAAGDDGKDHPEGTPAERWAFDIVNDLLRLFGTDA